MKIFGNNGHTFPDNHAPGVPLLMGLGFSAILTWAFTLALSSPGAAFPVFLAATSYILIALVTNALGVYVAGTLLQHSVRGVAWRSAGTAGWLAPFIVHLEAGSIWSIPIAIIVVTRVVVLFRFFQGDFERRDALHTEKPQPSELFNLLKTPVRARLLSFVLAVASMQWMMAAELVGNWWLAVLFAAMSTIIFVWHFSTPKSLQPVSSVSRGLVSSTLTLILALWLTTGGFGYGLGFGLGFGASGDAEEKNLAASTHETTGSGGEYRGIILLPPSKPKPDRIQLPGRLNPHLSGEGIRHPLRIPFDGVYWYFKPPDRRPPRTATVVYGNPTESGFRSTDRTPLIMEAHQQLLQRFELNDFDRIELAVTSGDRHPEPILVELLLVDASSPERSALSLGWTAASSRLSALTPQILPFAVPILRSISSFNEVAVRFHLSSYRKTVAPRIAVDSLILVPKPV